MVQDSTARKIPFMYSVSGNCADFIFSSWSYVTLTAKKQYRKFETNIPRKGMVWPQSQFPHSCACERMIYSQDRSTYFPAAESADRLWEYIIAHRHMNVEIGLHVAAPILFWEYLFQSFGIVIFQWVPYYVASTGKNKKLNKIQNSKYHLAMISYRSPSDVEDNEMLQ